MFSAQTLKVQAAALGFNLVGVAPAQPSPRLDAYFRWINAEMHGEMAYMARPDRQVRRRDLEAILPGVRSIILVGLDYHAVVIPGASPTDLQDPSRGRIAAYAWGSDYHELMAPRLEALASWLSCQSSHPVAYKVYVDTGAILERSHAQQAGLGFIGKNTMLIHPRRGSYFFLGEILTDLVVDEYDQPTRETMCGTCTRCQVACPTAAFPTPFVLDARRCISYLTIEFKGWIEPALRPLMGNWVYGCDACQDACPFSRFVVPAREPAFIPTSLDRAAPPLLDLLRMDMQRFMERFAQSPIQRIGRDRFVRNACIAAGNWGASVLQEPLIDLLRDASPLVRGHAAWALGRIADLKNRTQSALAATFHTEADETVQREIRNALNRE